jgi:hypothetical protein
MDLRTEWDPLTLAKDSDTIVMAQKKNKGLMNIQENAQLHCSLGESKLSSDICFQCVKKLVRSATPGSVRLGGNRYAFTSVSGNVTSPFLPKSKFQPLCDKYIFKHVNSSTICHSEKLGF